MLDTHGEMQERIFQENNTPYALTATARRLASMSHTRKHRKRRPWKMRSGKWSQRMVSMEVDVRNVHALDDAELSHLAKFQRRRALEGDRAAYGLAHELEKELRRRGVAFTQPAGLPEPDEARPRPWWRFWH
tara:strand:- start:525 stop:920 length:396 start_codon:yes stop_codon:yes gene_type:complete